MIEINSVWSLWVNICIWFNTLLWSFAVVVMLKGKYDRKELEGVFIFIIDGLGNIIFGTLVFLEPPREFMLTSRMKRIKKENRSRNIGFG